MTQPTRWLDLEGAVNARDVGGLPVRDGGRTALRRLLRSDNLQGLTSRDVAILVGECGLRTVVDLRTSAEIEREGPGPLVAIGGVEHHYHSVLPEGGERTDVAADALATRRERALARFPDDPVVAYYLGYLEDRPDCVVGALRSIARSEGAAIVNCAAGKDRTGVVVALTLEIAGVIREATIADYAASGDRIEAILDRLRASATYAVDIDKLPADAHRPKPATMQRWLGEVDSRFGGAEAWARSAGLDSDDIASLRNKLTDTALPEHVST